MSFFAPSVDLRADTLHLLDLVSIDTPDGVYRFMLGVDGIFIDVNGNEWIGATLFSSTDTQVSTQGEAPSGSLTISFIPDPFAPNLVSEIRDLGTDYVRDREVIFWVQHFASTDEYYAPASPPARFVTRRAREIEFDLSGALERRITLSFEGPFTGRNTAPGFQYTVADHARLIGEANTSLRLMPTDTFQEQKLFG